MNWTHIINHHTEAEEKDTVQVRRYHFSLGWRNIGYNYVIERDGRVVTGRSLGIAGAHCKAAGMNNKAVGIAVIGNLDNRRPTDAQYKSLIELNTRLSKDHNILVHNILGHKGVPNAATACHGKNLNMNQVRADVARKLNSPKITPAPSTGYKVGQQVLVKKAASRYATGESIASFVKGNTYTITQLKSDRALLSNIINWGCRANGTKYGVGMHGCHGWI